MDEKVKEKLQKDLIGTGVLKVDETIEFFNHFLLTHFATEHVWIAGGSVRDKLLGNNIQGDIDIFFPNNEDRMIALDGMGELGAPQILGGDNPVYFYGGYKVQFVGHNYYKSPKETIDSFDFTVCQVACTKNAIVVGEHFVEDVISKNLRTAKITHPHLLLNRLQKYIKKGYTALPSELSKISEYLRDNKWGVPSEVKTKNVDASPFEAYPPPPPRRRRLEVDGFRRWLDREARRQPEIPVDNVDWIEDLNRRIAADNARIREDNGNLDRALAEADRRDHQAHIEEHVAAMEIRMIDVENREIAVAPAAQAMAAPARLVNIRLD